MNTPLSLFAGYGIEIEYMIVDQDTLNVLPIADRLLTLSDGSVVNETENGDIAWSNELVLHVIELKTNGPAKNLKTLPGSFTKNLTMINDRLQKYGACLMPGAMHPWMNPYRETVLWPHDSREIYDTYHRIFNCEGHGWSNLQSMHINLPFANDSQFASLHSAIRVLLPLLPALAASSPIVEARVTRMLDTRLETYRMNAVRIPSITGQVIPEPVNSCREYGEAILKPMYDDIEPFDKTGVLQQEWLNSRGAIARFDRNAIEIRVLDTQETPLADLAIAAFVVETLKNLVGFEWSDSQQQNQLDTGTLADLFRQAIITGEQTVVDDRAYLRLFEFPDKKATLQELLMFLREAVDMGDHLPADSANIIDVILEEGPLARRLLRATGPSPKRSVIEETYRVLCRNLLKQELFTGI